MKTGVYHLEFVNGQVYDVDPWGHMTPVYVAMPSSGGGNLPSVSSGPAATPTVTPFWSPAGQTHTHYEIAFNTNNTNTMGPFSWGDWQSDRYFIDVLEQWNMGGSSLTYQFGESHARGNFFDGPGFNVWSGQGNSSVTTIMQANGVGTSAYLLDNHAQQFDYSGINYSDVNGVQHSNTAYQSIDQHSGEAHWASLFGGSGDASWSSFALQRSTTSIDGDLMSQQTESVAMNSSRISIESYDGDVAAMLPPPQVLLAMSDIDMFGGKG